MPSLRARQAAELWDKQSTRWKTRELSLLVVATEVEHGIVLNEADAKLVQPTLPA